MSSPPIARPIDVAAFARQVWVVEPGIDHAGIAAVCERFASHTLAHATGAIIICDVGCIVEPDLATVSLLARMQLTARRHGRGIQLHGAQRRLIDLIGLAGLDSVLPLYTGQSPANHADRRQAAGDALAAAGRRGPPRGEGSALEPGRQAEQREEAVHIEEVVDGLDPPG